MRYYFVLMASLFLFVCPAQTLTVINKTTAKPVAGAYIFSRIDQVISCSDKGLADVSQFKNRDSVFIGQTGYQTRLINLGKLNADRVTIELEALHHKLSEVLIAGNRWQGRVIDQPLRAARIDSKTIAFQNPQTSADVLAASNYVFVQKSQLGGGSPMLRGMATNRVLLVVDGVRMNNAIFRAGNLQNVISIDANALEEAEVRFGPGSVMYGSDAIGGVMTFKTLEPKLADTSGKFVVHGNALLRGTTANKEKTKHLDLSFSHRKWAAVSIITHSGYGDLRGGTKGGVNSFYRPYYVQTIDNKDYMQTNTDSSLQIGTAYSQINFLQKIVYQASRSLKLDYGLHLSQTSPYQRYDRLYVMQTAGPYKNKLRWAEWSYGPQLWNMQRLGLTHTRRTLFYDQLQVITSLQNFEESRYDREFMVRETRMQKETVRALALNFDLSKTLSEKTKLGYGLELIHNLVNSTASLRHVITEEVSPTVTRYPTGSTWLSCGAYLTLKHQLNKYVLINAGLRYSYYEINAAFDTTYFPFPFQTARLRNSTPNGSLGFVVSPKKSLQLYANAASGFRAPNIDDMGKVFESTPGYLVVPNPGLKPEHGYNLETGFVQSLGNFLRLDAAGYYTFLNDAMERKDFLLNGQNTIRYLGNNSRIQAVQNITKVTVYGLQCGLEVYYKNFTLRSNWSYQKGKELMSDSLKAYPLRHAAPAFGSTHLSYERKKFRLEVYCDYNSAMSHEQLALTERINPSYARDYSNDPKGLAFVASWYTLNFKASITVTKNLSIMAGVENITDQLYRPYSSGLNAPGRNFIFSLRGNF